MPPTSSLSTLDKDLLWKFRFSLFRSPRSLTKFLKCVTWSDPVEAKQAVEKLLPLWGQDVGMDDALELLGPGFTNPHVRAFAVRRLERAEDDELLLYLLQLVQALKFEPSVTASASKSGKHQARDDAGSKGADSGLSDFLIGRSVANPVLGTAFHWYLMIECGPTMTLGKMYARVAFRFMTKLSEVGISQDLKTHTHDSHLPGQYRGMSSNDKPSWLRRSPQGRKKFAPLAIPDPRRSINCVPMWQIPSTGCRHCLRPCRSQSTPTYQ